MIFVFPDLIKRKYKMTFAQPAWEDYNDFYDSFRNWKQTGIIKERPWMRRTIHSETDMQESAEWLFQVIDVVRIPLSYFSRITEFEAPPIGFRIQRSFIDLMMCESCENLELLIDAPNPVGKKYHLQFNRGSNLNMVVNKAFNGIYYGKGKIDNYMKRESDIEIQIEVDRTVIAKSGYILINKGSVRFRHCGAITCCLI